MVSGDEVRRFLNNFKVKMSIWEVVFRNDRQKNVDALLSMEIKPNDRKKILEELQVQDYSQGPIIDTLHKGTDMWVFGKKVKGHEIYIKITMGIPQSGVICISFHKAEHPMKYPLK